MSEDAVSNDRNERELRSRFQELRSEAGRIRTPDFDAMIAKARSEASGTPRLEVVDGGSTRAAGGWTRRRSIAAAWVTLAAAALAGVLLVERPSDDADAEFELLVAAYAADAAGGAWRSPTAALLDIPGPDLGAVPSIGGPVPGVQPTPAPPGRDS